GARIMLTDLRAEALSATADRLRSAGVDVAHRVVDVSDRTALSELAAETLDRFGHVDLLCNNAGSVSPGAATWEQTPDTWRRLID
ncbi:SDR family NAD(P)-dependent oxidoreductase, partial [Pseudomonas sp. BGM005]|nr:SDR family NAD(P)-dependent oxidoreductase [Pseudomonas sp. BG5]